MARDRLRAARAASSASRSIREQADLFYIGGGQDRDQRLCALDLAEVKREGLHAAAERGAAMLAVCGGYQLLGHSYELGDETLPGVGLVDLRTVRSDGPRLIGNVAIEVELPGRTASRRVLAGFENHGGRTRLGPGAQPLGRVLRGHGNDGASGFEGVRQRQRDRHLPARPAAAEERVAGRLADRESARARRAAAAARRRARSGRARRGAPRGRRLMGSRSMSTGRRLALLLGLALALAIAGCGSGDATGGGADARPHRRPGPTVRP